ncbi:MAG TPA: FAD-dependent oxidoreductase [Rhizomicrobium sp.]|nr:FAD-dependent oxidoreductase [Rhizomicrobium sp.]
MNEIATTCVIAGGGPAGMMTGYLLARAGVDAIVLEKHKDFLRDFRGDTIHPSTMEVMAELGLLEDFLKRPHQEIPYAEGEIGDTRVRMADFTHLPVRCKYIAFMPQHEFLDFLSQKARALPHFHLMMETKATALLRDGEKIVGVEIEGTGETRAIKADLVVCAEGRHSHLRDDAGLKVKNLGAPMDVLWFKLDWHERDSNAVLGRIEGGRVLVMLYRGDYWQCAYLIAKDGFEDVQRAGLDAFRRDVAHMAKRANANEIKSWDDVSLLTVTVDRLEEWAKPGLLFIGDAAHAMSPIGGIGINLAIQDAVATANLLAEKLRAHTVSFDDLKSIQQRRHFPTWATQAFQVAVQNNVIDPVLKDEVKPRVPGIVKLMQRWPFLQRIPARLIGMGFRPEHVRTSAA